MGNALLCYFYIEYAFERSSSALGRVDTCLFMFVYKTFPNVFRQRLKNRKNEGQSSM
jgi:hypothetical protein